MRKDLQRKMGVPPTGKKPEQVKEKMSPAKAKSFAALAPPKDKITFADKIAGAKKEVDEMLGDVAAEAIKGALSPKQKKIDMNKNGRLDANDFAMLRKGGKKQVADEGWDDMVKDVEQRRTARKVGDVTHGDKHDTQEIPGGRRVTRRVDPNTGYSVGADSDAPADGEKRGRGRPKGAAKAPERVTAKATKHKGGRKTNEGDLDITDRGEYDQEGSMAKDDIHTIVRHARALEKILGDNDNLPEWVQAKLAKIEGMMTAVDDYMQDQRERGVEKATGEEGIGEESTNKRDNRAERAGKKVTKDIEYDEKKKDGIHGNKRGAEDDKAEKAGKKVAKDIEYDEKKSKKKEKTEEQGGTGTPTASSGFSFGQGIYDSMNRELESMIAESMNVSMSMNTDANGGPSRSITVTATDDDAMKLGELLKNAGLGGHDYPHIEGGADMDHPGAIEVNGTMDAEGAEQLADKIRQAMGDHEHGEGEVCDACGQADCECGEEVDEAYGDDVVSQNSPDFPSNTETSHDAFQYSGGLNKPKASGMATIPVTDVVADGEDNFGKPAQNELARLREMAGIKEAKKEVEEEKTEEGNLFTGNLAKARADGKKEADLDGDGDMEKVQESILDLKHLWSQYKG
jgi:alpha/beta superfamily hydrolase